MKKASKKKRAVVVGGGINGIINGILLSRNGYEVNILESSSILGGQFKDVSVENWRCDKALYIPQLTGIESVDSIFTNSCPLILRHGVTKDIAGHFLGGKHSESTQFPDIRDQALNNNELVRIFEEIHQCTSKHQLPIAPRSDLPLNEFLNNKFGETLSNKILSPISKSFWRLDSSQISSNALKIVHLQRIVAYDFEQTLNLKRSSSQLDSTLSFPDQLNVPSEYLSNKTPSIYPVKYGLHHLLDGLLNECKSSGIKTLTNCEVLTFKHDSNLVRSLLFKKDGKGYEINCDLLVWCAGVASLAKLLKSSPINPLEHPPINHLTCFILSNRKPKVENVYWSWDYDDNDIIRVSFPFNYSSSPQSKSEYLTLVEMHDNTLSKAPLSRDYIIEYLYSRNILDESSIKQVIFSNQTYRKFYVPSLSNLRNEELLLNSVESLSPSNLIHASNKISRNSFYLDDLLKDSYHRLIPFM